MFTMQLIMLTIPCIRVTIPYINSMYSVYNTLYYVYLTMYCVYFTMYYILYIVYSISCIIYTKPCIIYTMPCIICMYVGGQSFTYSNSRVSQIFICMSISRTHGVSHSLIPLFLPLKSHFASNTPSDIPRTQFTPTLPGYPFTPFSQQKDELLTDKKFKMSNI